MGPEAMIEIERVSEHDIAIESVTVCSLHGIICETTPL